MTTTTLHGASPKNRHRGKALNRRALTAFIVTWAFAVAMVTGTVLYIVPQGRVAYWTDWALFGLGKETWGNVHIIFGAIFIVAGVWHLYFNWKPFKKYLADRASGHLHVKREAILAGAGAVLVMVAAVADVPPASWLFDLNSAVKQSWVTSPDLEPPYGHAEESSLRALSRRTGMDLQDVMARLKADGIAISGAGDSLKNIARRQGTTPMDIYARIKAPETQQPAQPQQPGSTSTARAVELKFEGTGIGRKTLAEMIALTGVAPKTAVARLAGHGIKAETDETLRKIADRHGLVPLQVLQTVLVEDFRPARN